MADKKEKFEFDNSRIISSKRLAGLMKDARLGKEKFCFILGSGASVESGIPTGINLVKRWMKELSEYPGFDEVCRNEAFINKNSDKKLKHDFKTEIMPKWEKGELLGSEYYSDIYSLRFFPNPKHGYYFYEELFSKSVPSFGYNALVQILADGDVSNLVITTNFDSLVEDALFIYTDKKPLVINHESLAGYAADSNLNRPIVAKVHRGLYFAPLNTPEETDELKGRWSEVLSSIFKTYTPVVIGYGGGDEGFMKCLENSEMNDTNGIYWCYRENSGLPDERILKLISDKNGWLVKTAGFDAVMLALGNALAPKEIEPQNVGDYLKKQCDDRVSGYEKHYNELMKESLEEDKLGKSKPESESEREFKEETKELDKRVEATENSKPTDELTAWDYFRKGNRAIFEENDDNKAIDNYNMAIKLNPEDAYAYLFRGYAYDDLKEYGKAIEDYSKAVELNPKEADFYYFRGVAYDYLKDYDKAIEDYSKAIELNPEYAEAYKDRGNVYRYKEEYDKAIEDYSKAIEFNPEVADAYYFRGFAYDNLKEYDKAIEDYNKAIELNPEDSDLYYSRGFVYADLKEYDKEIEDYSKAIELNPEDAELYYFRAKAYEAIGETEKAKADKEMSEKLKAKQGDSDDSD